MTHAPSSDHPNPDGRVDLSLVEGLVPSSQVKCLLVRWRARTLVINGVSETSSAQWRLRLLEWEQASEDPVVLVIDSSGGDARGGRALFDALRLMTAPTIGLVIGRAYSATSEILQGCRWRLGSSHARLMVHHSTGEARFDLRYGIKDDWISEVIGQRKTKLEYQALARISLYSHRTGRTTEDIGSLLNKDLILSARKAVEMGLLDAVVSDEPLTV